MPYASGRRAFGARQPLPTDSEGHSRLPRVLRETTAFLIMEPNIKTEGLFRIPPHSKLREVLREAYDRGQKFIVWKEYNAMLPIPAYSHTEDIDNILGEVDQRDAYGVHLAASLIKLWYAELRQPLFPPSSYEDLRNVFKGPEDAITIDTMAGIISPRSGWLCLPFTSRGLLVRHLLPLLSAVELHEQYNMMDRVNLAVCLSPALVRGPDPLEDAKMFPIIRQLLGAAIDMWTRGLRHACQIDAGAFGQDLRAPASPQDYEDPLQHDPDNHIADENHFYEAERHATGITMEDNDTDEFSPPKLPPRPLDTLVSGPVTSSSPTAKWKWAPANPVPPRCSTISEPPRYSTIMADESGHGVAESPVSYTAVADGFAPHRFSG